MLARKISVLCCLVAAAALVQAHQNGMDYDGLLHHRRSMLNVFLSSSARSYEFGGLPTPYILDDSVSMQSLAERVQLPREDVLILNPLLNAIAQEGQVPAGFALNVPSRAAVPPLPATLTLHTGDEARAFAQAYGITLEALAQANPKVDFDSFEKPQTIHVPAPTGFALVECPEDAVCVQPSEGLTTLSARLSCDVEDILAANPHVIKQGGHLFVNQVLRAPGSAPAPVAGSVKLQAGDALYDVLLKTVGTPISPAYLARLAVANDAASMEDVVAIAASEIEVELVDPASAEVQLPVAEEAQPMQISRRRLMSAPDSRLGASLPVRGRALQPYGRKLPEDEDIEGAPLLTRLHTKESVSKTISDSRSLAESNIERSVAEGDADGLLNALQMDMMASSGPQRRLRAVSANDADAGVLDAMLSRVKSEPSRRNTFGGGLLNLAHH